MELEGALGLLIPIITMVAVFTFASVAVWTDNRRKERESYYHHETLKKLVEQPGDVSQRILDEFRRDEIRQDRLRQDGLRLGGMITSVVGVGLIIFLRALLPDLPIYLVGILPLLIGVVLVAYSFMIRTESASKDR